MTPRSPDPLDRLALLSTGPVPPLAGAAAARDRGRQRTRRARTALAGAGAVVAVLAVTAGVSLAGSATPDRVDQRAAEPRPVPSASPEDGQVDALRPEMLLDAAAVQDAVGGSWSDGVVLEEAFPRLMACAETTTSAEQGLARGVSPAGTDAQPVTAQLLRYPSADAAQGALESLITDVLRCPSRPEDSEDGRATVSTALVSGATTERRLVEQRSRDCPDCPERFRLWELHRTANVLLLLAEADVDRLAALRDAAVSRLQDPPAATEPTSAEPTTAAPADLPFPDVFLTPEQAAAAETPGWSVDASYEPSTEPLLDPCEDGSEPAADRIRATGERRLASRREAGGSSLVQEVFGYDDPVSSGQALQAYADRVRRCPTGPVPDADDHSVERTVVPVAQDRLLVQERYCGPTCTDNFTTWVLLARVADRLSVARYSIAEDGDPREWAAPLLEATRRQLQRA